MPPEPAEPPELPHDLANPEDYLPGTPWWIWALVALAVILVLSAIIYFIVKRSKHSAEEVQSGETPFEQAKTRFTKLRDKVTSEPVGEIATYCSLTLRECLGRVLREQVLFETDEEIKLRPNSFAKAPEKLRPTLIELLENLGEEKYAPSQVDETRSLALIDRSAETLVTLQRELATASAPTEESTTL